MSEVKEITMDELKGIVGESIKDETANLKSEIISEMQAGLKDANGGKESDEEKVEKAATFIKDLCNGNLEKKAIDSTNDSFGYTVPTELANFILTAKDKIAKMRKLAFVFSMSGNFQLPVEGTGVTAYWVGENDSITESNPTVTKKNLTDYYLAARVLIPRQLINTSAYNVVNFVGELCARKLRDTEETAFIAGDGDGKPTGLRSASITAEAQSGSALAYDDVVDLFYSLPEQYRENAVFLTSAKGIKALRKIQDEQKNPLFDFRDQKVMNKPVLECADIPANLGSGADTTEIYFGDMWYYWIKDGENMFVDTDKVISKLQVELVVAQAVDGVYTLPNACRKLTGVK